MLNGPVRSVQQRLGRDTTEIGLWLNEAVVVDPAVESLREDLDRLGVVVRGCNGFPQTSFHAPVVKRSVYRPHWGQFERLQYTKRLAEVLVKIGHGPVREISTVPIGHQELGAEMLPTAVVAASCSGGFSVGTRRRKWYSSGGGFGTRARLSSGVFLGCDSPVRSSGRCSGHPAVPRRMPRHLPCRRRA